MYRVGLSSREVLIVVALFEISAFGQQQRIGSVMISSCERHPHETAYGAFPLDVDITIEVGFEEPDVTEQYCSAFGRHGVEGNGDVRLALKHLPHGAICETTRRTVLVRPVTRSKICRKIQFIGPARNYSCSDNEGLAFRVLR